MTTSGARRICLSSTSYPPAGGGLALAAARLAGILSSAGYDVHVVTPVPVPGARGEVATTVEGDVTVHRISHADPNSVRGVLAVRDTVQRLDRDAPFSIFHGFFLPAAAAILDIAERGGRPLVASARGSDVDVLLQDPQSRRWLLAVLRRAAWVTAVSEHARRRMAEEVDLTGRSSVIYNSVAPLPASAVAWSLSSDRRGTVGTVGEFRKVKDIPLLVRAYATVPAGVRRGLRIAGYFVDEDERAWTETLISELGLAGEAVVTGRFPHAEIGRELSRLHVYTQSSAHEGMPNSVLEAAQHGVPIVATAVGGVAEVFENGVSALLVPHGDRDALGDALARALTDDDLAARLSAGARGVAARLNPERERQEWLELYQRVRPA